MRSVFPELSSLRPSPNWSPSCRFVPWMGPCGVRVVDEAVWGVMSIRGTHRGRQGCGGGQCSYIHANVPHDFLPAHSPSRRGRSGGPSRTSRCTRRRCSVPGPVWVWRMCVCIRERQGPGSSTTSHISPCCPIHILSIHTYIETDLPPRRDDVALGVDVEVAERTEGQAVETPARGLEGAGTLQLYMPVCECACLYQPLIFLKPLVRVSVD